MGNKIAPKKSASAANTPAPIGPKRPADKTRGIKVKPILIFQVAIDQNRDKKISAANKRPISAMLWVLNSVDLDLFIAFSSFLLAMRPNCQQNMLQQEGEPLRCSSGMRNLYRKIAFSSA